MPADPKAELTLTSILERLSEKPLVAPPPPPASTEEARERTRLSLLPEEEKRQQAWAWKLKGIPVTSIARMFAVDQRTIYRWFRQLKDEFRKTFENETSADNLAGQLMHIDDLEQMCLYEAAQLARDGKAFDPESGVVTDKDSRQLELANKARFLKMAMDCRQMQIRLLLDTGIIPKERDKMYRTLEEEGKVQNAAAPTDDSTKFDRKQTIKELLDVMERGGRLA